MIQVNNKAFIKRVYPASLYNYHLPARNESNAT